MDASYKLLQEIWFSPKHESKDAFQDDGKTGIIIESDQLVTVKQKIGRVKNNTEEVFQYHVHAMFDNISNKWWPSLDKKIWIKSKDPENDNKYEMMKLKSIGRKEKNKTNENSKPTATKKKLYRLLVKMVEGKNGLYKEMDCKEADH